MGRAIAEDGLDGERQLVRPSAAVLVVERAEFSILWRPEEKEEEEEDGFISELKRAAQHGHGRSATVAPDAEKPTILAQTRTAAALRRGSPRGRGRLASPAGRQEPAMHNRVSARV